MAAPLQPEQHIFAGMPEVSPLVFLLRRGLDYVQQGRSAEATALFALVREQLSSRERDLGALLDTVLHEYAEYMDVERAFQEASGRFATAHDAMQARMASFGTALSALMRDMPLNADHAPGIHQEEKESEITPPPGGSNQHLPRTSPLVVPPLHESDEALAPLTIICFGRFEVRSSDKLITLCSNRSGQRILRFLVSQPGRKATSDTLQAMLWPEDEAEVSSRKLYLAISALRRSLSDDPASEPRRSYILCKNRVYYLNTSVTIQTDVDEFLRCYRMGQQKMAERMALYESACQLYTGPFLPEDIYADWSFLQREQLAQAYLTMRSELTKHYLQAGRYEDAVQSAQAVLKENRCDELAYQHLIQVYIAQGRRSEALQQYLRCERALREELGVKPLPETTLALQTLLANDTPSPRH